MHAYISDRITTDCMLYSLMYMHEQQFTWKLEMVIFLNNLGSPMLKTCIQYKGSASGTFHGWMGPGAYEVPSIYGIVGHTLFGHFK